MSASHLPARSTGARLGDLSSTATGYVDRPDGSPTASDAPGHRTCRSRAVPSPATIPLDLVVPAAASSRHSGHGSAGPRFGFPGGSFLHERREKESHDAHRQLWPEGRSPASRPPRISQARRKGRRRSDRPPRRSRASRASAAATSPYPDWIPASTKPPKRGGTLTRASAWDPPVLDPRLTQSVGLFQFAGLTSNRLVRYVFPDEATSTNDLTLKGDLAESWQASPDHRVWTFKLRQGVKWQNVPPLNGRELVAADVKYCFEQYAKEGVQSFTFQEIEGDGDARQAHAARPSQDAQRAVPAEPRRARRGHLRARGARGGRRPQEAPDRHRALHAQGAQPQGAGVLPRNPDYFDKGRPYLDEYVILSTPDAATRLAAFRTGQSDFIWVASPSEAETVRKTNPAAVVQAYNNTLAPFGLALAQDKPPFNDVRVRRAISMAIDRQKQVDTVFEGHGILGWGVPYIYYQDKPPTAKDLGPVLAVPPGRGEEAARRGRPPQRVRDDAVLLRVLPADDVAGAARPAGPQEEPQHRRQDHQARLHDLLRPLRRRQVGRDVVGVPVGPRRRARRADLPVHALQVARRTSSASTTPSSTS